LTGAGPAMNRHVVFASHTAEVGVFRVGSHHLSREFRRAGCVTTHLSTPFSLLHAPKLRTSDGRRRLGAALRGMHTDGSGRNVYIPLAVLPCNATARYRRNWALRTAIPSIQREMRRLPPVDILLIDEPLMAGLWELIPARRVVYRPTDVYPDGTKREAELRVLEQCDAVVGTSAVVLDNLRPPNGTPTLLLENGVDYARFAGAVLASNTTRAGAVYVGAIDGRFDWDWLAAIAGSAPSVDFTIAGPVEQAAPGRLPANVHLIGPVPYKHVPALLAGKSIGLLPFRQGVLNEGRSPMKLYEYLASGLHVVRTPGASGRAYRENLVHVAGADQSVARLIHRLDRMPANRDGQRIASEYDWPARAERLLEFLTYVANSPSRSMSSTNSQRLRKPYRGLETG
jgi:glycosyltransferase involved in cell wall biosynthesis